MLFELPPFEKAGKKEEPKNDPVHEKNRAGLEGEFRALMNKRRYEETSASAGAGIIEGDGKETYDIAEKVGFLGAWNADLAEIVESLPEVSKGQAGASRYERSSGLLVEWDQDGVRPVWIRRSESGASGSTEKVFDMLEIANRFTFLELERAYDNAKAELERLKKDEERKQNGPQPPSMESGT
ncbi:MAG: hypothetical protein WCJ25_01620 [Candidatus Moraniibacteriota bacterium]